MTLIALTRADGNSIDAPGGKIRVHGGDSLLLIGSEKQIRAMEELGLHEGGLHDSMLPTDSEHPPPAASADEASDNA